jgi:protocatechuate 3,4-dioxygenase beta subunit
MKDDGTPCVPVLHPYLIGDTVWYDANGNGVQDNGETGIAGVTVTLLDSNGQPIPGGTAVTDANGQYSFKVEAGTYSVQVNASNFNTGGALVGLTSTTGGEKLTNTVTTANILTYDFGYHSTVAGIGDFVWNDLNGNGIQDSGELGPSGVTVNLLGSDGTTMVATTTTDGTGEYYFTNLTPGAYYVQFVPPVGMSFTTKNAPASTTANDSNANLSTGITDAVTLAAGQTDNTIDAGVVAQTVNYCATIRTPGFWKNYSNHMSSATFLNLIANTQDFSTLTVSQAVTILSTNNGTTSIGIPALDGVDATFLKFLLTSEINAVWNGQDNAAALGGLLGTGTYQGTGMTVNQLLHQTYLDRRTFSSSESAYVLYLGGGGENVGASLCLVQPYPASIGDQVWNDLNGNGIQDVGELGIQNVTVQLLGSDGTTVLGTTTTDASGKYSFPNLLSGTYYVQFTAPSGFIFTTQNAAGSTVANDSNASASTGKTVAITLAAGQTDNTIDAGLYQPAQLSGYTYNDLNGNGTYESGTDALLTGVTIFLDTNNNGVYDTGEPTTTSNASGFYQFTDLPGGTYHVIEVNPAGYISTGDKDGASNGLDRIDVTLAPGDNNTGNNFLDWKPATIGDFVWADLNGNGIQDAGEPGIQNVTVQLIGSDGMTVLGTTTTNASGKYSFTNLKAGTYYVQFTAPSGFMFTQKNAVGSTAANDSNANLSTGRTVAIILAAGATDNTIDAGLRIVQTVNYCGYIRTPGFWKNYSNHMSSATFQSILAQTQDFSYLTVSQAVTILSTNNGTTNIGIPALDGVNATFLKFLLTSEINAVWNGQDNAAGLVGQLGIGAYQGTGLTVYQLLSQAYLNRRSFSSAQFNLVLYLGSGGEGASASSCLVQPK